MHVLPFGPNFLFRSERRGRSPVPKKKSKEKDSGKKEKETPGDASEGSNDKQTNEAPVPEFSEITIATSKYVLLSPPGFFFF